MSHHETNQEHLSHDEIMYNYFVQRGMELAKIDLFLSSRNHYEKALQFKPNDPHCLERMRECTDQIREDRKKVLVIVPILLAVIGWVICANF